MKAFQGNIYHSVSDDFSEYEKICLLSYINIRNILIFLAYLTILILFYYWVLSENSLENHLPFLPPLNESIHNTSEVLPVSHVFIVSAYYYPTSKSLGHNAVALNMLVDSLENATFNIIGSNKTSKKFSVTRSQQEKEVPSCRYATTVAFTNTLPTLEKLEIEANGVTVEIPFKIARYTAPKPVIICISPQFVAEQWQIFMMHAHVSHRFGGYLHIYLISILDSYFDLMNTYEKQGYITIDFWLKMKFQHSETPYFEPNRNTELRNQIGAQTDCLLQYKEAAQYIAFFDMDDILFPMDFPSYLEEFDNVWLQQPNASSIAYGRREHEFVKAGKLSEFSFYDIYNSLRSAKGVKPAKVVVKPDRYNSTGLHFSAHENPKLRIHPTSPHIIHVQRPLQKHGNNEIKEIWKFSFGEFNETINIEDVKEIENDIQRFLNTSGVAEIGSRLPQYDFYFPIVFKCYADQIYRRKTYKTCPNAERCRLPQREDLKCIHSDAEYISGPHIEPFTFHFAKNSFWSNIIGCYQ